MKKILIFTHSASGHHPEYLHHLYLGVVERQGIEAVFVVPLYFQEKRKLFSWPECDRISFDYIPDKEVSWGDGKWYKRNYRFTKVLKSYTLKHQPEEIFMIDPMMCMPYLAFIMPRGAKISGILYEIYQYRWKSLSFPRKIAALIWHWLLAKNNCFKTLFLLNDSTTVEYNNHTYHTNHFCYLPDPFMPLRQPAYDFRQKFRIDSNRRILFHFGSFGRKKGTLEILKSVLTLSNDEQKEYCFVFAGCIQSSIHDEFYYLSNLIKAKTTVQLFVFDEFCSYDFLAGWCAACDAILVPYLEAYNSSGCIGYAAQFMKPVVGPNYGLLGKLIKDFNLGIQIANIETEQLIEAYHKVKNAKVDGTSYLKENTVEAFCQVILDGNIHER